MQLRIVAYDPERKETDLEFGVQGTVGERRIARTKDDVRADVTIQS